MIKFMDELIYGKKVFCMDVEGDIERIVLYLHQTTPDILVANSLKDINSSIIFNVNVVRVVPIPLEDEETFGINSEKSKKQIIQLSW